MRTSKKAGTLRLGGSCTIKSKLPSFDWIRDNVPIREVACALGLELRGRMIRCPRKAAHKHGDANPSMNIGTKSNKAYCNVCDRKPLSNIDLVMLVTGVDIKGAVNWIAGRWPVEGFVTQRVTKTKDAQYLFPKKGGSELAEQALYDVSYKELPSRRNVVKLWHYVWSSQAWLPVASSTVKTLLALWHLATKRAPIEGEPPFAITQPQRKLAEVIGVRRPTIRKALEFGREIGLLEYDQGFRSVHEEARRPANIRFTPYSSTLRHWLKYCAIPQPASVTLAAVPVEASAQVGNSTTRSRQP